MKYTAILKDIQICKQQEQLLPRTTRFRISKLEDTNEVNTKKQELSKTI